MAEVLDDHATFCPEALRALRDFRREKPWRGDLELRLTKLLGLNVRLARAYGIEAPRLHFASVSGLELPTGNGAYFPSKRVIVLYGRLSVVTYLHEFAHARGMDERRAVRWSVNLFRRMFPRSYARLRHIGHTLRLAS